MSQELMTRKIEEAGHRIIFDTIRGKRVMRGRPFSINVRHDQKGEHFTIDMQDNVMPFVLDIEGDHLLLMFKVPASNPHFPDDKFKALIGHDERQLFVAAIPESTPVSTVFQAKEALKPKAIREFEKQIGIKTKNKQTRHARGKHSLQKRLRQGDFFFVPCPNLVVEGTDIHIHKKEPISRGRGTSHICEELVRAGGENIYFLNTRIGPSEANAAQEMDSNYPNGMTENQRKKFFKIHPESRGWTWSTRRGGDIKVHVRGAIRHPEHATLNLDFWHEVIPNTENKSKMMQHIAFVD